MGRFVLFAVCTVALSASEGVGASSHKGTIPCHLSVSPRVEGPIDPQALSRIVSEYREWTAPALVRVLNARCTQSDSIEFRPVIRNGKLSDVGVPEFVWTSVAIAQLGEE